MARKPKPPPPYDPSLDRHRLAELQAEFHSVIQAFCDHQPLLRGSLQKLARRCGKAGCRCSTLGLLHRSRVFIDRTAGERRVRQVTAQEWARLRKPTQAYRALRRLRARLSQLIPEALRYCDRLCAWRLQEGKRYRTPP
jgi:hypothetical protein